MPGRRPAGIRHQKVDTVAAARTSACPAGGDVRRQRRDLDAMPAAGSRRRLQRLGPPRIDHQIDARLCQRFGTAPTQPLGGRRNQSPLALYPQIHGFPLFIEYKMPCNGPVLAPLLTPLSAICHPVTTALKGPPGHGRPLNSRYPARPRLPDLSGRRHFRAHRVQSGRRSWPSGSDDPGDIYRLDRDAVALRLVVSQPKGADQHVAAGSEVG